MKPKTDLLSQWPLNDEQRRAVAQTEGPLRIIAGPGSGKTRVLTYRIAYILKSNLASPQGIFAVTFTNKAAGEMRGRVQSLLPDIEIDDLTISTFHSLAYGILRAEAETLGFNPNLLRVCQPAQSSRLVRKAMRQSGLKPPWNPDVVIKQIERAKDTLTDPETFVQMPGDFFEEGIARAYKRYQELLKEKNLVDFGDLIRFAVKILTESEESAAFYQEMCRYLLVDEFQDTSYSQYVLMKLLAAKSQNLCVIGDPLQSIYSWRGADPANMMQRFNNDYPDAQEVLLTKTYRSTQTILNAADAVVQALGQPSRNLQTDQGAGDKITLLRAESDRNEAMMIVAEITRLTQANQAGYNDMAVLVRTGAQRRLLEQAFLRAQIPYRLVGEKPFFRRREVLTMLGYLRLAADPFDAGALSQVINTPPRGLGRATLNKIRGDEFQLTTESLLAAETRAELPEKTRQAAGDVLSIINDISSAGMSLPNLFDYILERSGYLAWLRKTASDVDIEDDDETASEQRSSEEDSLAEMRRRTLSYDHPGGLEDFLEAMETQADDLAIDEEGVALATLHAVKGLEFPVVFMGGLEEGLFPHAKSVTEGKRLDEEYRLFYVGLTRAQRKLYLSYARYREVQGQARETTPSRLLRTLPNSLLERRRR